ncbi:hypothetical protein [Rhodococcus sp. HNM0569]|uniref:hypothetical protein n=1 Tax=Rhodococcus sp. HNM0569 TaxID=2716340 RepID=UPI00146AAFC9|nr:hypothetical protein [Rhodococcus sp. HNM0569]NLU85075.1 hypothetical protein [Rhodococcus sp. HNM0569]
MSPAAPTAALRGSSVGAVTAALSIAAHGIAGGGLPTTSALTLLVLTCAGLGAAVAGTGRATRGVMPLAAALALGQFCGHVALAVGAPAHDALPGLGMLGAHAAATAVCAGLVLACERLYGPLVRTLRVVFAPPRVPARTAAWVPVPGPPPSLLDTPLLRCVPLRGPPAPS